MVYLLAAAKSRARTRGSNAGVEVAMGVSSSIKIHLVLYQQFDHQYSNPGRHNMQGYSIQSGIDISAVARAHLMSAVCRALALRCETGSKY